MTDKRDVKLAKRAREKQFEQVTVAFAGKIISWNGSVKVPGVVNHVWVLPTDESEPVAVYNRYVKDTRPNLDVVAGFYPHSKVLEILRTDVEHLAGYTDTGGLDIPNHGSTHRANGDDPVWVDRAMIIDQLYLSPGSGLAVNISPYEYDDLTGARQYFAGKLNHSIAASQPAAGLARYVLVYLDTADNTIKTVNGATTVDLDWKIPAKPNTPEGGVTAGYVRLDGAATSIARTDIDQGRRLWLATRRWFNDAEGDPAAVGPTAGDGTSAYAARRDHVHGIDITSFVEETTADDTDVLLIHDAGAGANRKMTRANLLVGVGGGNVWAKSSKANINATEYADLEAAYSAVGAGGLIILGTGTHTLAAKLVIAKAIEIVGISPYLTKITFSGNDHAVVASESCSIKGVEIESTSTQTGAATFGFGTAGKTVQLTDVKITRTGAAAATYGIYFGPGTIIANRCEINASGGTASYAVYNDTAQGAGTCRLTECRISGSTYDIFSDQSGTVITVDRSILVNNLFSVVTPIIWQGAGYWANFTPTVTQSGSVAVTTNFCRYAVVNKIVHLDMYLSVTGSGSAGNVVAIDISNIPAAYRPAVGSLVGPYYYLDSGTSVYAAIAYVFSATAIYGVCHAEAHNLGITPNFAMANGDQIRINGFWRIA